MSVESFISLYSNVGIKADLEESIIKGAEFEEFEEFNNVILDSYQLQSVLFLAKFDNGALLSDRFDFSSGVEINTPSSPISLTTNSFTNEQFKTMLGKDALSLNWTSNSISISCGNVEYYSYSINGTNNYNYMPFNYNKCTDGKSLKSLRVFCKWNKYGYFSLAFKPNFLRVQTNHEYINYIAYKYTKNNTEYTGIITLVNSYNYYDFSVRQYTGGYKIYEWKETDKDGNETDMISNGNYLRIYSNRDKISFLMGSKPNNSDNNDEDIYSNDINGDFTLRYTKEDDEWKWLSNLGDGCTLTGIWIKFLDRIKIITSNTTVNELTEYQLMYGNGTVINNNEGYVYSNSTVVNNGERSLVYGNGIVETNDSRGFVYGNGNVTTNKGSSLTGGGKVYGNGNVTNNNGNSSVYGNGDVETNDGYVYGNGNTKNNKYSVYGNGDVKTTWNIIAVYGNGRIFDKTNGEWVDNTEPPSDSHVINGNIININTGDNIVETVKDINKDSTNNIVVNSCVIKCNGTDDKNKIIVQGNIIRGNSNTVNGFRIYGNYITIGVDRSSSKTDLYVEELKNYKQPVANVIIGNKNVINPIFVDENLTGVTQSLNVVIGNNNVINDPNTIVLKGTCNVFNDIKN